MKDLKIRVDNDAESREVQELFFELGYKWFSGGNQVQHLKQSCSSSFGYLVAWSSGCFTDVIQCGCGNEDAKEITLPQLRDLVVLKRNDVGDATHESPCGELKFILLGDWWNLFTGGKWQQFSHKQSPHCNKLKTIEKPMKEYLRKNNDGEYILEVTDEREAQEPHAKHWIEVPKGCDYLISVLGVNSFIDSDMFAKFKTKNVLWSRKPMKEYLDLENGYKLNLTDRPFFDWIEIPEGAEKLTAYGLELIFWTACGNYSWHTENSVEWDNNKELGLTSFDQYFDNETVILWQRPSTPEELPFIDDEPKIETATGYQLDVVGSNTYGSRSRYDGESDISYRQYLMNFIVGNRTESLNDQYAEIEKVRQSAWQKQEGGSHYKNLKIQPMQYALENKLDYAQANVVKYVTRHKEKNGKEDLLKAIHNIELMIEFYYGDEK